MEKQYVLPCIGFETEVLRGFTSQQPPMSPFLKINLSVSCRRLIKCWVSFADDDSPPLHDESERPLLHTDLTIDFTHFQRHQRTLTLIKAKTKDWPISDKARVDLLDKVNNRVREVVKSMQPSHNHVTVRTRVTVTVDNLILPAGRRITDNMVPEHLRQVVSDMVRHCHRLRERHRDHQHQRHRHRHLPELMIPADESAIQSLVERENIRGFCCVCLDEYSGGTFMPCEHGFHRGCITKWLKINHLCPLCRYEMPVDKRFI